jgi:hypothetical protein
MPSGIPSLSLTKWKLACIMLHRIHVNREQRGSHLMPPGILSLCLGERAVYAKCKGYWLKQYSSQHMTMNACPVDYKLILLIPNAHKKSVAHKNEYAHIYRSCTFMGGERQKGKGLFSHAIQYCIPWSGYCLILASWRLSKNLGDMNLLSWQFPL